MKEARYNALMELQQGISLKKNQAMIGKTLEVLVEGHGEGEDEDGESDGRRCSVWDAATVTRRKSTAT